MVKDEIEVVAYDLRWPEQYRSESRRLREAMGGLCVALEHMGSTAVPGLAAKPVIDMMAAVESAGLGDRDKVRQLLGLLSEKDCRFVRGAAAAESLPEGEVDVAALGLIMQAVMAA